MTLEVWTTLGVVAAVLAALIVELTTAEVAFMAGLALVVVLGVLPYELALEGFANGTLIALGSLFIVARALRDTGALSRAAYFLLGKAASVRAAILRLIVPVSLASAFVNNTPIVAMGIPSVRTWARDRDFSASRLLIPLSYASIFGGMCTLMGTSTNLVAHGMLKANDMAGFSFFELAKIGVPCTIVGWIYLVVAGPWLIKSRAHQDEPAVAETTSIKISEGSRTEPHSIVIRPGSHLIGERLEHTRFTEKFNATVIDVRRGGHSLGAHDINEVVLHAGDTLILEAGRDFRETFEDSPEFYVTSSYSRREAAVAAHQSTADTVRMYFVIAIVFAIVGVSYAGILNIAMASLVGALVIVLLGIVRPAEAIEAIDWQVLIVIGAALGLGEAMSISGAAQLIGHSIVATAEDFGPVGLLAAIVIGTTLLTEVITNNGAVALFFPIALSVAASEGIDPRPLIVGLTAAGSMSMLTPIGYQTNLMVYSAGEYRFSDFVRAGGPLQIIFILVVIAWVPIVWPF